MISGYKDNTKRGHLDTKTVLQRILAVKASGQKMFLADWKEWGASFFVVLIENTYERDTGFPEEAQLQ